MEILTGWWEICVKMEMDGNRKQIKSLDRLVHTVCEAVSGNDLKMQTK